MIAHFPYLWLSLAREDFTASSSEFLDLINKAMNTNIGNNNLDDVSNKASCDSEEDDFEGDDETKDKLAIGMDLLRPPTGSLHSTKT